MGLAAVGLLVAGCSETEAGNPTVENGSPSSGPASGNETDQQGTGQVPKVQDPIDLTAYLNKPCELFSKSDLAAFDIHDAGRLQDPEKSDTAAIAGPGCAWTSSGGSQGLQVTIQVPGGGLAGAKRARDSGNLAYWEPTTVESYPAVFANLIDRRDQGDCSVFVGVNDDLTVGVVAYGYYDEPAKACPAAKKAAGMMIKTVKKG